MGRKHAQVLLFFIFISLHIERSVTCVDGTYSKLSEGTCFLYYDAKLTYFDAKAACELNGVVLAKATSSRQITDISISLSGKHGQQLVWIGANDIDKEGAWVWEDGGVADTQLSTLWFQNEPNKALGKEDCALVTMRDIDGNDYTDLVAGALATDCNDTYTFVCSEKAVTTTAALTTTPALTTSLSPSTSTSRAIAPATTNIAVSTSGTSAATTTTNVTNVISTSTPNDKDPVIMFMKCGANLINSHVLLCLTLCFINFLFLGLKVDCF